MQYHSRPVDSKQSQIHPHLRQLLQRHSCNQYRKPIPELSHQLFALAEDRRRQLDLPLILDSGCGTGAATRTLALQHPDALVIGVDKSAQRLARGGATNSSYVDGNCLLLRMNLVDFWRLALQHGWRLQKHYLLYPNPWPKSRHLRRRWHGHPVFPHLLALGGIVEMRCNWRVYAEEFQAALNYFSPGSCQLRQLTIHEGLSLFEKKYAASGHTLYQCLATVSNLDISNQRTGVFEPVCTQNGIPPIQQVS